MAKKAQTGEWSKLEHAGGAAGDVPDILAELRSHDAQERAHALRSAWSRLWSEDEWYSAQPPFVTALFALAADPAVKDRHKVVDLALNIVTQGTGDKVPRGLDFTDAKVKKRYARGISAELHRILAGQLPFLLGLLEVRDAALRAIGAASLAFVFEGAAAALNPLARAMARERETPVLGTMVHVLGVLMRHTGDFRWRASLDAHASPDRPTVVRACAHTGLLAFEPAAYCSRIRELLVDALDEPPPSADLFPLKGGLLDQMFSECVFVASGSKEPLREFQLEAISRRTIPAKALERLVEDVISYTFEERRLALREDFSAEQLAALEVLSRRELLGPFHFIGVPEKLAVRRRWLELDPQGPLNWPVEIKRKKEKVRWPVWKALLEAEETVDARPKLLRKGFSPLQILEILTDRTLLEWEPEFTDIDCGPDILAESLDAAGVEALPWALATAEKLLSHPDRVAALGNASLLPIVRSLGPGESLDPRYDAVVFPGSPRRDRALEIVREVLDKIPLHRREAIFLREGQATDHAELRFANTFELCPTPTLATFLLEVLDGKHAPDPNAVYIRAAQETFATLLSVARREARVAEVLQTYNPERDFLKRELKAARKKLGG